MKERNEMNFADFLPVWDKLSEGDRQKLAASALPKKFFKGSIIHDGSEECTGLMLIKCGQIRAYTTSPDGREITLYRLFERDICLFSASCMMNSIQFELTLSAEKDTEVMVIPAEIYKSVMSTSAPLANFTNEVMASRFSDVMWLIEQIMWKSFDKRLAAFLVNEANIDGENKLKITHEVIGNHLGSPREVVTRMLKYFAAEGMVRLSRGVVELTDESALEKLAES